MPRMTDASARQLRQIFDAELLCNGWRRYASSTTAGTSRAAARAAWHALASLARCAGRTSSRCLLIIAGLASRIIETDDGVAIQLTLEGFALARAGGSGWRVAAAVRFSVDDPRYRLGWPWFQRSGRVSLTP